MFLKIVQTEFRLLLRNPFYWIAVALYQIGFVLVYHDYGGFSARHLAYSFHNTAFYAFLSLWATLFFAAMARREDEGLRDMLLTLPATNSQLTWGKFLGNFLGLLPLVLEVPVGYIGLSIYRGVPWDDIWNYFPGITSLYLAPYSFAAAVGFASGITIKNRGIYLGLILYWLAAAVTSATIFGTQETLFQFQGFWASWLVFSDIWGTFPLDKLVNSKLTFYAGISMLLILIASIAAFPRREKTHWITLAGILIVSIPVFLGGYNYFISKYEDQQEFKQEFKQYMVPIKQARAESEKIHRGREEDIPPIEKADFEVDSYSLDLTYNAQNLAMVKADLQVILPKTLSELNFTLRRNFKVKQIQVAGVNGSWKNAEFKRKGDGLEVTLPKGTLDRIRIRLSYEGVIRHQRTLMKGQSILYYFAGKEGVILPVYYGWYPLPGRLELSKAAEPDKERPNQILSVAESFPVVDYVGPVIAEMTQSQVPSDFYLRVTAPTGAELFSNLERKKVTRDGGEQVVEFAGNYQKGVLLVGGKLGQYERHGITFLVSPDYEVDLERLADRLSQRIKFFENLVPGSRYQARLLVLPGTFSNFQRSSPLQSSDLIIISEYGFARMLTHTDKLDSLLAPLSTFNLGTEPVMGDFYPKLLSSRWKAWDKKMFQQSNRVAWEIMEFQHWLAFREVFGPEKFKKALEGQLRHGNALLVKRRKGEKTIDSPVGYNEVLARLVELEEKKGLAGVRPVLGQLYAIAQQRSLTPADFWTAAGIDKS